MDGTRLQLQQPQTYTNSSLTTHRRCARLFALRYGLRMSPVNEGREALDVGSAWHDAHDAAAKGLDPYGAIDAKAPSSLWAHKLKRLFAAHGWYWREQRLDVVMSEWEFAFGLRSRSGRKATIRGKVDAIVRSEDGRFGILEYKTTSDAVDDESGYWRRLAINSQVGIYGLAFAACDLGKQGIGMPSFIFYDATKKPTISPKKISAADLKRLASERTYFGEEVSDEQLEAAQLSGVETELMYAARLTSDIGDRPSYYFGRREVSITREGFRALEQDIMDQVEMIDFGFSANMHPRNPDECSTFGTCDFLGLCSQHQFPQTGHAVPTGFEVRERLHPELNEEKPQQP